MMKLFVIQSTHIHQVWHKVAPLLKEAITKSENEYTLDQLKMALVQGKQTLLVQMDEEAPAYLEDDSEIISLALTIEWNDLPNDRIAFVSYISGTNTLEIWEELITWVKANGGTKLQGVTNNPAIVKLWDKQFNMKPIYTLMNYTIKKED
jgi:hypothetical protein